MFRKITFGVLGAMALALSSLAQAAPSMKNIPPALNAPLKGGLTITKRFSAPSGLTGWLLKDRADTYYTFFTTADGKLMMAGALIDSKGENLTQKYQNEYEPKVDISKLMGRLGQAGQVISGPLVHPKSVVYAFIDPNCPFCHLFWEAMRPYEAAGVQVHWIVTGFLRPSSHGKAAAILAAQDPQAALVKCQTNFKLRQESGSIQPLTNIPARVQKELAENLQLMHEFKFQGVPGIIYHNAKGALRTHDGMPKLAQLPAITGIPAQPETAPELQQFR